jgi:hypothetical protein
MISFPLSKPWLDPQAGVPRRVHFAKGLLGAEERRALYWLAREVVLGEGHVVDAGSFMGASAFALAAGLTDSRRAAARRFRVHCYDMFTAFEAYTAEQIARDFGGHDGSDFRDVFAFQTGQHGDRLVVHQGDLLRQRWTGEPVELLFIDVAKTRELNFHIMREFFLSLMPGHSIVLHQDYFFSRHPLIHATMEFLSERFVLVDPVIKWCTRAWRLEAPIMAADLDALHPARVAPADEQALIARARTREAGEGAWLCDLLSTHLALVAGDLDGADARLSGFRPEGDADLVRMLWAEHAHLRDWRAACGPSPTGAGP